MPIIIPMAKITYIHSRPCTGRESVLLSVLVSDFESDSSMVDSRAEDLPTETADDLPVLIAS